MSKVKAENYIVIQGWMLTDLQLKGNELIIYAIIYGFTQSGDEQVFSGTISYLSEWTNLTKVSVISILKSLTEKGYITKFEEVKNGVKFCQYKTNLTSGKETLPPIKETLPGGGKETLPGGKETLPNNIEDNKRVENLNEKIGTAECREVVDLYNLICTAYPKLRTLSDSRVRTIKARRKQFSIEDFRMVFQKAQDSDFLKGNNNSKWSATFDWMIKDSNFAKILDGNYDNKPGTTAQQWVKDNEDLYNRGLREWVTQG